MLKAKANEITISSLIPFEIKKNKTEMITKMEIKMTFEIIIEAIK